MVVALSSKGFCVLQTVLLKNKVKNTEFASRLPCLPSERRDARIRNQASIGTKGQFHFFREMALEACVVYVAKQP